MFNIIWWLQKELHAHGEDDVVAVFIMSSQAHPVFIEVLVD